MDPGVEFLLASDDPSVRYLALSDLLDRDPSDAEVRRAADRIPRGPRVSGLLDGLDDRGVQPYAKWTGAHWRLVSLVELAAPLDDPRLHAAAEGVLDWLTGPRHRRAIRAIDGRVRRCASQEGNALAVCSRLGMTSDPRVRLLADSLVEWRWPDGGWNCDKRAEAWTSSAHESLIPIWGLTEFGRATGEEAYLDVARDAAERVFVRRGMFRSRRTGEAVHPSWTKPAYPPYWHYDVLQGLLVLSRIGPLTDPRLAEAVDLVASKRRRDGTWGASPRYWRPPGSDGSGVEVVDWGRRGPSEMGTLNALRVLKAAGRSPSVT